MKRMMIVLAVTLLAAGCAQPPRAGQMEQAVNGLADLHKWDPGMEGQGQYAYDAVMGSVPDVLPHLVAHLTDENPTAIYEPMFDIRVCVGDVCFLMLLRLTGHTWQDFDEDGVFMSTQLDNPIFCLRWKDRASRKRVQDRFRGLLGM